MMLSDAIRNLRTKAFLSQDLFAKELHVTVGTINRWENGKSKPSITTMKTMKEFCERNKLNFDEIEKLWFDS